MTWTGAHISGGGGDEGAAMASPGQPRQVDAAVVKSPANTSVPSNKVDRSPTVLIIITREAVRRQAPGPL